MSGRRRFVGIAMLAVALVVGSCASDPTPTANDDQRDIPENTERDVDATTMPTTDPAATALATAPTTSAPDDTEPETTNAAAESAVVSIVDFAFDDQELEIPIGTTVRWVNDDPAAHSVVADDGSFASDLMESGDTFEFTFEIAGQFQYACGIHPSMTAMVAVLG